MHLSQRSRFLLRLLLRSAFCVLSSAFLPACNIFEAGGAIVYKVSGPPAVPARYVPPAEPMLVIVENYEMPTAAYHDAEMLSRAVMEHLKTRDVAPLVPAEPLYNLRSSSPKTYHEMSIAAIGRELGAKQVLYIELQSAVVEAALGSQYLQARGAARVRIVDVESGLNRWPLEAAGGHPVSFETPLPKNDESGGAETIVRQRLHHGLAERIGRLFYKWKPQDLSPQDE